MVSTITPSDRLGFTFQVDTERIRTIAYLHELSIPGRISDGRHSASPLDAVIRETSLPGSTDGLGNYNILDQEDRHIASRVNKASWAEWQDDQGGAAMLGHEDKADGDITRNESAESDKK